MIHSYYYEFIIKKIYMKTGPKPRNITTQLLKQIELQVS